MISFKNTQRICKSLLLIAAAFSIVCWPAFTTANCCCKRSHRAQAFDAKFTSTCCQTKATCCQAMATTSSPACCSGTQNGCARGANCECNDTCTKYTSRVFNPVPKHGGDSQSFATTENAYEDASYSVVAVVEKTQSRKLFLLAQDHCALMCRWLK